jgi:hypothetical protein
MKLRATAARHAVFAEAKLYGGKASAGIEVSRNSSGQYFHFRRPFLLDSAVHKPLKALGGHLER